MARASRAGIGGSKMDRQQLRTVKQAAEYLNCSTDVIREMIWSGRIGYININPGGKYIHARFTQQHLEDFLKRNEVKAG